MFSTILFVLLINCSVCHLCPSGTVLWPADSSCHTLYTQGPCLQDQVLVTSLFGPHCSGFSEEDKSVKIAIGIQESPPSATTFWNLPNNGKRKSITSFEEECLAREEIYWPIDGHCYTLLTQGPCPTDSWLVLRDSGIGDVIVTCAQRSCPCDPARLLLCEVELQPNMTLETGCKCKVALAAAQDGLCEAGEQLLVNPYGYGECGCISSPPHITWPEDNQCYPVHSQGPCDQGQELILDINTREPICKVRNCPEEGQVKFTVDGKELCYTLGQKGPCEELEILELDEENLSPICVLDTSKVKRVFDIIPHHKGLVRKGPLARSLQVQHCILDSRGRCRKTFQTKRQTYKSITKDRGLKLYIKKRSSKRYLKWLQGFRNRVQT